MSIATAVTDAPLLKRKASAAPPATDGPVTQPAYRVPDFSWPRSLPKLTTERTRVSDANFKKRRTTVISPQAWRQLRVCLFNVRELLIELQEARGQEFLQNARLTGEWSIHARYWPEEKPDAATVTPRRVVRLVQTILQVTEEYYELLGESICKTEESEDPRVQDKLEDWEDRHSGLDELAVYSQREGQRDDSLDSVLDTFENLSFELDV